MGNIDLANDQESLELIKACLSAIALHFENNKIKIDLSICNAARIWKLYGTRACKGDKTADRPHRVAKILAAPDELEITSRKKLEKLAAFAPKAPKNVARQSNNSFDLEAWITRHLPDAIGPRPWFDKARKWVLDVCPWNQEHTNRAMYIVQFPSGAIAAGCHHNGCADKGWPDLRELFEPGYREAKHQQSTGSSSMGPFAIEDWHRPLSQGQGRNLRGASVQLRRDGH